MKILETENISKTYGHITALDSVSLTVEAGQVVGILGPNGSGKTTLLGILLGVIHPNHGNYKWFKGKYGYQVRRHLGALLETPNFYPYLHADDNLAIIRHIKRSHEPNFDHLLELVGLKDRRSSKYAGYSLGMRQRLAIAAAMIGDPEVLILDEPTNGLDPEGIADVRNTIIEIAAAGKTIILASHMLDEVEKICSHVMILRKGKLLANGPVRSILSENITLELYAKDLGTLFQLLADTFTQEQMKLFDQKIEVEVSAEFDTAGLNQDLMNHDLSLSQLVVKKQSLESEFLDIIKK